MHLDYNWFMNFQWELYSQLVYCSYLLHVYFVISLISLQPTHIVDKSSHELSIFVMGNAMSFISVTPQDHNKEVKLTVLDCHAEHTNCAKQSQGETIQPVQPRHSPSQSF